ncbi:MAG TPA: zinc-binding dehydrogenase [Thermoanaerobaculia bacterium]|nr:zinc-binding dehydrogenase [Thermoanaerobaculia bacterium]
MKAVFFRRHGGNEVLEYGDWPDPVPGPGEVLVGIRAAALNRLDLFVRDGIPGVPLPLVAGADGAGVVEATGEGVSGSTPGDRVLIQPGLFCGVCEFCRSGEQSLCVKFRMVGEHGPGTFAEKAVVPAVNVFPIPAGLSFEQAAAFPLAYQTAWRMIVGRGKVRPGDTVLIHGIGGGVGWAALEIAVLCGARVIATTSAEEKARGARAAGAAIVVDYTAEDVGEVVRRETAKRGVDVVVDTVGEKTWLKSLKSVRRGGRIVTCGATSGPNPAEEIRLIYWKQISILGSTMANDREFRALLAAVGAGRLRPRIDRVLPLSRAPEAYRLLEEGRQFGKIVLVPDGSALAWPDGD